MIARTLQPPHLAIHTRINQALCSSRVQQQMVDAEARIALPAVSHVIPECVHRRIGMQRADRIDPTLIEKFAETAPEALAVRAHSSRRI